MKAIVYAGMLWCLYGIPADKWHAMSDMQQDAALEEIANDALQELGCREVEVNAYEGKVFIHIYAECSDDQYIAMDERRSGW